ncbi:MAG: hypothetical protein KBC64_04690 [Simkaniaceae bacterium]|nr:hypothetical protein [Simkaniaceae bacterium]
MSEISKFIEVHYDVVRAPDVPFEDCKTFLLPETHDSERHTTVNGLFISTFATPESIFLMEGVESCTFPYSDSVKQHLLSRECIKPATSLRVLGWDMKNFFRTSVEHYDAVAPFFTSHCDKIALGSFDWEVALDRYLTKALGVFELDPIQNELYTRENITYLRETFHSFGIELNKISTSAHKTVSSPEGAVEQLKEIGAQIVAKINDGRRTIIASTWDERVLSMIETLRKVHSEECSGKVFLIAGKRHLIQKEGGRYPLEPFTDYLRSRPDIAILKVKKTLDGPHLPAGGWGH